MVSVKDKQFEPFISNEEITTKVLEIAHQLNEEYRDKDPLFLAILNGSFIFASNIIQNLDIDCEITFIKVASYDGVSNTGPVKLLIGLREEITGRHVVILEDIIDTGNTITQVFNQVKKHDPADVKVATLLFKPNAIQIDYQPDYVAFEVENHFYVGYGLDYNGFGRNLKGIYKLC
ncbi:hypoxanthine phosphoribosyltransferase [Candidatus Amoebophilus asiaticus]|nr:hypoxanthine phosphoribosyltransferase [Candidatus Amoebophilus asiaticus]